MKVRAPQIDKTAISPHRRYCDGYGAPGAEGNGYVCALKVATATVEKGGESLLDGIVAYDRAEADGAYLGQVNMITASSFCGLAGQVWGYDLATAEIIAEGRQRPLMEVTQHDGSPLAIHDAQPLLDATVALFGSAERRRFPPAPGAHLICANRSVTASRPKRRLTAGRRHTPLKPGQAYGVWCLIALSIGRDRDHAADLFIEDAGRWRENDDPRALEAFLERHRQAVVDSIVACGRAHGVAYARTYLGYAYTLLQPGQVGTALAVAPYLTLARDALPAAGFGALNAMTLAQWEREMGFDDQDAPSSPDRHPPNRSPRQLRKL